MNNNQTLEKMKALRLFGMSQCFTNAVETGMVHEFKADEFIAHLIEAEYDDKCDRKIKRAIKNANFRLIAQLEDITYAAERNITKKHMGLISELRWLKNGENIIVTGQTGTGKTFLTCASGLKACMHGYKVAY